MEAQMDIQLGVPVANPVQGDGRVSGGSLPAGRYATLVYTDVAKGREGNGVLVEWAKDNGNEWDRWHEPDGDAFRSRYESFLTPPDSEPDKTNGTPKSRSSWPTDSRDSSPHNFEGQGTCPVTTQTSTLAR